MTTNIPLININLDSLFSTTDNLGRSAYADTNLSHSSEGFIYGLVGKWFLQINNFISVYQVQQIWVIFTHLKDVSENWNKVT